MYILSNTGVQLTFGCKICRHSERERTEETATDECQPVVHDIRGRGRGRRVINK